MNQRPRPLTNSHPVLTLERLSDTQFGAALPEIDPEGRNVIFGGQILAQTIIAAATTSGDGKEVKSINVIFARAGSLENPMDLEVRSIHAGRTWASDIVEARQGERVLAQSLVLLHEPDPDLVRHQNSMPAVPGPEHCRPIASYGFPGSQTRLADITSDFATTPDTPFAFWTRYDEPLGSVAEHQAVLSWATNGALIAVALGLHPGEVDISQAHHTLSTGVIGHSISFCDHVDARQWLLFHHEPTHAGRGRVTGRGQVFSEDGRLVAVFHQDSMAKAATRPMNPSQSM